MKSKLSVVIPNYNGGDRLFRCLKQCFQALSRCGNPHEVILVDDSSHDFASETIQKQFPTLQIILNPKNLGFGPSCNRGAEVAQGDWILFLNNDCYLDENYFYNLVRTGLLDKPDVFSIQGAIYNTSKKLVDAAKFPRLKGIFLFQGIDTTQNFKIHGESAKTPLLTFFSSGCNALVNHKMFKQICGFDRLYAPFYTEDADLGLTAWRMGWESYFVPEAQCIHEGSATISQIPNPYVRSIAKRNRWIFHIKHLPTLALVLWLGIHLIEYFFGCILQPRVYKHFNLHAWSLLWRALKTRSTPLPISTAKVIDRFRTLFFNRKAEIELF